MPTVGQGTIRLFRFSGVTVFLHWSWFLIALFEINSRAGRYSSIVWNIAEYLSLFLIVLMHEFGHSLACRQVGGLANRIILWPMGGVAFVNPPPRPGATLWSIAAGPLVNVLLFPVFTGLAFLARSLGWAQTWPDLYLLVRAVWFINIALLVFNILPIYPLVHYWTCSQPDGGHHIGIYRCGWIRHSRHLGALDLVRSPGHLHAPELLGWFATCVGPV
jgi:Zn-dependent protease